MIQVISVCVAPVSRARSGRATLRPLTADTTVIRARETTARTGPVRRVAVLGIGTSDDFNE